MGAKEEIMDIIYERYCNDNNGNNNIMTFDDFCYSIITLDEELFDKYMDEVPWREAIKIRMERNKIK